MKLMTLLHSKLFLAISALMVAATAVVSGILLKTMLMSTASSRSLK